MFIKVLISKFIKLVPLVLLLFLSSCKTDYSFQAFSYPPGSKPHENDWEFTSLVIVSSKTTPITAYSKKTVRIRIFDKKKKEYLDKKYHLKSSSIRADVEWKNFEVFHVSLFESGNESESNSNNDNLLKEGSKLLFEATFLFNRDKMKFMEKEK